MSLDVRRLPTTVATHAARHFGDDHYYWLTAYLAARDLQARTCRLNAGIIAGMGLIPLTLLWSPLGAHTTTGRLMAIAVTVTCLVMASLWLRHCWPSRLLSQMCAVIGAVCIAIAALTPAQPLVGLLGFSGYVVLSGYVALFHPTRLLLVVWVVAGAALVGLAMQLSGFDSALVACGAALLALTNVFVAFACRLVIRLVERDDHDGDLEPLTGLLTRDAFTDRVAMLITARSRWDDRYLAVIAVTLDGYSVLTAMSGVTGTNRARVEISQRLRETVRDTAVVAHVGEAEFLIAEPFTTADPTPLIERISDAVKTAPFGLSASIGAVSTPLKPLAQQSPVVITDELVTLASARMYEARRGGGNRSSHAVCPKLATLEDESGADPHA